MREITGQQNNKQIVNVIWTDPKTKQTYQAEVDFDAKLDFNRMDNIVLSF